MNLFQSIRLRFFCKKMVAELPNARRQRQTHTIWSARTVGILFDATPETDTRAVLQFARGLEKDGRAVHLMGYFHDKKEPAERPPFEFFTRKMTAWPGLPKSENAEAFARQKFDLLLVFNLDGRLPLEWIAARSLAAMKIGPATHNPNDFDIMLDIPPGKDVPFFLAQLDIYLDKIVLPQSPSNRAVSGANRQPSIVKV